MVVPPLVIELDEAYAPLHQPPRQDAVGRERARLARVLPVALEGRVGLRGEVTDLGHARLHGVAELVLGDALLDRRIELCCARVTVERGQGVESAPSPRAGRAVRVGEVEHLVLARAQRHALVARVQESIAPEASVERLSTLPRAHQHHEPGEVVALRAEPVADPAPQGRTACLLRPRLHERRGGIVIDRLGEDGTHDAEAVGDPRRVREPLGEPRAGLAVLRELER